MEGGDRRRSSPASGAQNRPSNSLRSLSTVFTQRIADDATARLKDAHTTALQTRALVQTRTMVEAVRNDLAINNITGLQTFVPDVAKNDPEVVSLYVIDTTDKSNMVMAHSDERFNKHPQPVAQVDPDLGPRVARIAEPVAQMVEIGGERRFVFASPVTINGKQIGTLVVQYNLHGLEADLSRIEADRTVARRVYLNRTLVLSGILALLGALVVLWQWRQGLRVHGTSDPASKPGNIPVVRGLVRVAQVTGLLCVVLIVGLLWWALW